MSTFWERLRKIKRKHIIWIAIIIIVVGTGFWAFSNNKSTDTNTLVVSRGEFLKQVSVSGKVTASDSVNLSFADTGRVTNVNVKVGDLVTQGQTLASEVTDTLLSQLQAARADLAQRQAENSGSGKSLEEVTREQDTLVDNARQQLLSNDLVAIPAANDNTLTPPTISGLYTGSEGRYKVSLARNYSRANSHEIRTFELEQSGPTVLLKNEATPLGTKGLFITLPEGSESSYDNTIWYINIPNTKSTTYLRNFQDYQEALRTRDRAVAEAGANLTNNPNGVNASEAAIQSAQAEVARIQAQITERTIYAPFAGIITKVDAKNGEVATANTSAISMISANTLQIESYVPEINLPFIQVGDIAEVTLDAYGSDVPFEAKVVSIDPAETIKDGVSTYRALLEFTEKDDRVKSGMTANVVITSERKPNVIVVPQKAVTSSNGKKFVTVRVNDQDTQREVTTGSISSYGEIEIISGLSDGDVVVLPTNK